MKTADWVASHPEEVASLPVLRAGSACLVRGCDNDAASVGLCAGHWQMARRRAKQAGADQ